MNDTLQNATDKNVARLAQDADLTPAELASYVQNGEMPPDWQPNFNETRNDGR